MVVDEAQIFLFPDVHSRLEKGETVALAVVMAAMIVAEVVLLILKSFGKTIPSSCPVLD